MKDLLRKNGPFYKANLHCHTTFSDGKMTAEQVRDHYKAHGYSIVAFTDHSRYRTYPELIAPDFLPVCGAEAAFIVMDPGNVPLKYKIAHLNFWAKDPETSVYEQEEPTYDIGVINRYIRKMKKNGFLCGLNHPGWSRQTTEEINGLEGLNTFEIYNNGAAVVDNLGTDQGPFTLFLNSGKRAFPIATDDNHAGFDSEGNIAGIDDTCGGFTMLSMPDLSYKSFADAIENGRLYASTGVIVHKLEWDEEKDVLVAESSPVNQVLVKDVHTVASARVYSREDNLTRVEVPLTEVRKRNPAYFRVEFQTTTGKRAYTRAIDIDEIKK